jgi:hypothetical protein
MEGREVEAQTRNDSTDDMGVTVSEGGAIHQAARSVVGWETGHVNVKNYTEAKCSGEDKESENAVITIHCERYGTACTCVASISVMAL